MNSALSSFLHPTTATRVTTLVNNHLRSESAVDCVCGPPGDDANAPIKIHTHAFGFKLKGNSYGQGLTVHSPYITSRQSVGFGSDRSLVAEPLKNVKCNCTTTPNNNSFQFRLDNNGGLVQNTLALNDNLLYSRTCASLSTAPSSVTSCGHVTVTHNNATNVVVRLLTPEHTIKMFPSHPNSWRIGQAVELTPHGHIFNSPVSVNFVFDREVPLEDNVTVFHLPDAVEGATLVTSDQVGGGAPVITHRDTTRITFEVNSFGTVDVLAGTTSIICCTGIVGPDMPPDLAPTSLMQCLIQSTPCVQRNGTALPSYASPSADNDSANTENPSWWVGGTLNNVARGVELPIMYINGFSDEPRPSPGSGYADSIELLPNGFGARALSEQICCTGQTSDAAGGECVCSIQAAGYACPELDAAGTATPPLSHDGTYPVSVGRGAGIDGATSETIEIGPDGGNFCKSIQIFQNKPSPRPAAPIADFFVT